MIVCQHNIMCSYITFSSLVYFGSFNQLLVKAMCQIYQSIYICFPFPNHTLDHPLDGEWVMTLYLNLYIYWAISEYIHESTLTLFNDLPHWREPTLNPLGSPALIHNHTPTIHPPSMHSQVG